jgi:hypothetical protein
MRTVARAVRWLVPARVEVVPPAASRGRVLTLADVDRALDRLGPSAFVPRTVLARRAIGAPAAGFVAHRPATDARTTWAPALVVVGRPIVAPLRGAALPALVYVVHRGRR